MAPGTPSRVGVGTVQEVSLRPRAAEVGVGQDAVGGVAEGAEFRAAQCLPARVAQ